MTEGASPAEDGALSLTVSSDLMVDTVTPTTMFSTSFGWSYWHVGLAEGK